MTQSTKESAAFQRLTQLFDDGVFTELDALVSAAAVTGYGTVAGVPCYAFSQNIKANGGAVDRKHGEKITKIYDLARATGCPLVGVYDGDGMSFKEQNESLTALGKMIKASASLSGVIPQIAVVAGACLGGCAVMASMADVVITVKNADFRLTDAPDDAQEDVDITVDTYEEAAAAVAAVLQLLPENNLAPLPVTDFTAPVSADYGTVEAIADNGSILELKAGLGACRTALAAVGGTPVGLVAFRGSALTVRDADKAAGFVSLCDAYHLPMITLADCDGFGTDAALRTAAVRLTSAYAGATCPKISVVTKAAVGTPALLLAGKSVNADITFMWDSAVFSPLPADAAVAFLYGERLAAGEDRESLENEYRKTTASAQSAAVCGLADAVIPPEDTRASLIAALTMLSGKRETTLPRKHAVK